MNNKGFISTSVIYTLLVVFLIMLLMLLLSYYNSRMLLTGLKDDLRSMLLLENSYEAPDEVIYYWIYSENGSKTSVDEIPSITLYKFSLSESTCTNGAEYTYDEDNNTFTIISENKTVCNFYYTSY